jgi:hypothetical protein
VGPVLRLCLGSEQHQAGAKHRRRGKLTHVNATERDPHP